MLVNFKMKYKYSVDQQTNDQYFLVLHVTIALIIGFHSL